MVAVGDTLFVPLGATAPIPWSIVTVLAPVTVQLNVVDWPAEILAGFTSKLLMAMADVVAVVEEDGPQP
jgi:hypothetical protein